MFIFAVPRPKPHQAQPVDSVGKTDSDQLVQGAAALSLSQQNRNPSEQKIDLVWNRLASYFISLRTIFSISCKLKY